jgi:cytochrome c oxidase subunit 2
MNIWMLLAVVGMIFLVIFQIAKASEYVSVLKGEGKARLQSNRINAFMMVAFLVLGLAGAWWCHNKLAGETLFAQGSASVEGEKIDSMFMLTLYITGIVFLITQVLLFWFAYKYQEKEGQKAFFLPHNNKLELIWTIIPAITLTVLVVIGLRHWFKITGDAPEKSMLVEITGQQFGWTYRYPGSDGVLGKKNYRMIDPQNNNGLGQDWNDKANHDDIITTNMFLVKGKPVKLVIGSKDVIHDVGLPHFRLKMDAVPGIPTTLWFTPKWTTEEMRERLKNPDFEYEIVCDQLCGASHYAMRGVIKVVSQEEFDMEMAKTKPAYYAAFPDKDPATKAAAQAQPAATPAAAAPAAAVKTKM